MFKKFLKKLKNKLKKSKQVNEIKEQMFFSHLNLLLKSEEREKINLEAEGKAVISICWENIKYLFPHLSISTVDNNIIPQYIFLWGIGYNKFADKALQLAITLNLPVYIVEDGFLKSADTWCNWSADKKYRNGVSFTIDSKGVYFDATRATDLENLLNDKNLILTQEQLNRARTCIDLIVKNHLTKYNHQPIFTPEIGKNVKKVLVVDQSYGDFSILKGLANEETFNQMLEAAIKENPDADIIVKTHPDTLAGGRSGYFSHLQPHDNIYLQSEPINPISLLQYVDKVYVVSTQLGFEALLCNKEVHVFGMPFYAGWGVTHDRQKCIRRTNKRSVEELFYITYILYSFWVNPEKKQQCEIEDAMEYLLKLRKEYLWK